MAQDLTVNIKTTSDVPQAMEKSKTAVVAFSKQVDDIQKKFSTAFKDIFLGFFAPMIIINSLLSKISENLEEARRLAREGVDLIAKGEAPKTTGQEITLANIVKRRQQDEEMRKQTEEGKKFLVNWFAANTNEGKELFRAAAEDMVSPEGTKSALERFGGFEGLLKRYLESPEGKAMTAETEAKKAEKVKDGQFKGPEGFSNVVGVGANPVMEAMTKQLEEQQKQTALLEQIANKANGGGVPVPFTEAKQFPGYGDQM